MKLFSLIFVVAVMVQLSLAGPLSRSKRETLVEATYEVFEMIYEGLPKTEKVVRETLQEIPKTPAYAKYVQLFEGYLKDLDEYKNTPGNCADKTFKMFDTLMTFVSEMAEDDGSPEYKEFKKIIDSHKGEFNLNALMEKIENTDVEKGLEEMTLADALSMYPLMVKEC